MEIDNFCIKLTHHDHDIRLGMFTISDECKKLTQIPPKTKLLCVHGYGRIEQDGVLSQSLDNQSKCLCVLFVFGNAAIKKEYIKCFVYAWAVSDWMSISKNQKEVMIRNK